MAQIPGNELFPAQKTNYGSDTVITVPITLDTGTNSGYSAWYKPGNARAVIYVAEKSTVTAVMRPSGSVTPSQYRKLSLAGQINDGTATQLGVISGNVMPHEFALLTTDDDNDITIYFIY